MDINKRIVARKVFIILGFFVLLSSCEYETIEPIDPEIPEIVSFSSDLQPIFTVKCSGCHPTMGGLDLTEGYSYNSINDGRINSNTPPESLIYTKPSPTGTHPAKYSTTESALVLSWIEDGANNN